MQQDLKERGITHYIIGELPHQSDLTKVKGKVVSTAWLEDCLATGKRLRVTKYLANNTAGHYTGAYTDLARIGFSI